MVHEHVTELVEISISAVFQGKVSVHTILRDLDFHEEAADKLIFRWIYLFILEYLFEQLSRR
jgi:hypothetical protein